MTAPPGGEVCLPSVALRGKALLLPLGLTFSQLGYSQLVVVSHVNTHFSFLHLSVGSISRESNCSSRPRLHFLKKEQDIFHSEPGNKRHPMGLDTPWRTLTVSDSLLGNLPQALAPGSGQAWVLVEPAGCVPSGQIQGLDSTITQTRPALRALRSASQRTESYTNQKPHKNTTSSSMLLFYT